jgi:hypothetical protein
MKVLAKIKSIMRIFPKKSHFEFCDKSRSPVTGMDLQWAAAGAGLPCK